MSNILAAGWDFWHARRKEIIFAGIIVLVASFAFAVGYVTARDAAGPAIVIEQCSTAP